MGFKGLEQFYKIKDEDKGSPEIVVDAVRKLTLIEKIKDVRTTQDSRYEVRNINGIHICDIYIGDEHKGTYYLGSAKNGFGTQSILSYVMFNAAYNEEPESILSYKWRVNDMITVQVIGTLFSQRIREKLGEENFKPSYMKYPCVLGVITTNKGAPRAKELVYASVEEMQDNAQALRCFSYSDTTSFLEYMVNKNDEAFYKFYEKYWVENSGASEAVTNARDYVHAQTMLKAPKREEILEANDTVVNDETRTTS